MSSGEKERKWFRSLIQNPSGLIGLIIIAVAFTLAIGAYYIVPDYSPAANRQLPLVALKAPGYSVTVLKIRKNRQIDEVGFWKRLVGGQENRYTWNEVSTWEIRRDSIEWTAIDQGVESVYKRVNRKHLADVLYAVDSVFSKPNGQVVIQTTDGTHFEQTLEEITRKVEKTSIETVSFPLGSDKFGRCIFSRMVVGIRISLLVGMIAVSISLTVGLFLGSLSGYLGGKVDDFIVFLINTVWSIPTLLMVFAIVLALGRSASNVYIAIGFTMWVDVARIVRGQVMEVKRNNYIEAARSMGFSHARILIVHILPNIIGPLTVIAAANFATAILIEAGLSYLGFGIQPPTPSWGNMLNENYGYAVSGKPFLAIIPAFCIMLLVLAFNLAGNALRDAFDVKRTN